MLGVCVCVLVDQLQCDFLPAGDSSAALYYEQDHSMSSHCFSLV